MDKLLHGAEALGLTLSSGQLQQFETYYRELIDWNRRANLTRILGWEEVQAKHFLDSLTVTTALPHGQLPGLRVLDVGSGAGLPGVPLKILYPEIELSLLESVGKKTAFLQHLTGALGLDGVRVLTGRAEALGHDPDLRQAFDVVLARAVAVLPVLLELTLPFCRLGGRIIAQKDASYESEPGADRALSTLGGHLDRVIPLQVTGLGTERRLVVISKTKPTPVKYPRRPGIPGKSPL